MLTDREVKLLQAQARPYKVFDDQGLYLHVSPAGGKSWRLKFRIGGIEKTLSIGSYPTVSLAEARKRRDEARRLIAAGVDPAHVKQEQKRAGRLQQAAPLSPTLRDAADAWLKWRESTIKAKTQASIQSGLERLVLPQLGDLPLDRIRPLDIRATLVPVDEAGHAELARRLFQRLAAIFRYAATHGLTENDPTRTLKPAELFKPQTVEHRKALKPEQMPEFIEALEKHRMVLSWSVRYGLYLLMLTATRPGECRGAKWEEFDFESRVWRIPAERMKMRDEHIVPLAEQTIELLENLRGLQLHPELLFPSPDKPNQPISDMAFNSAIARIGYKGELTAHGFRSTFSTAANEAGFHPDVIELQLAHKERNKIRAAYNRALRLKDRADLMQWWADQILPER